MARSRLKSATRSRALALDAAMDATMGGALGLMVVLMLVSGNMDLRDALVQSGAPLFSLACLVGVMVAQFAVVAGICGALFRNFAQD